jgi:hypothetical protein
MAAATAGACRPAALTISRARTSLSWPLAASRTRSTLAAPARTRVTGARSGRGGLHAMGMRVGCGMRSHAAMHGHSPMIPVCLERCQGGWQARTQAAQRRSGAAPDTSAEMTRLFSATVAPCASASAWYASIRLHAHKAACVGRPALSRAVDRMSSWGGGLSTVLIKCLYREA